LLLHNEYSRTLEVWLRQPLVDLRAIQRRQDAVARLVDDSIGMERLREEGLNAFRGLDIDRLGRRLIADGRAARGERGIANTSKALEGLYKLHLVGDKCLPPLLEVLEGLLGGREDARGGDGEDGADGGGCALRSAYRGLKKTYRELGNATQLAERVIDFDRAPRDYIIRHELDVGLADVREELDAIEDELGVVHSDMNDLWAEISGKGSNQVKLEDVDANSNTSCVWQFRLANTNDAKLLDAHKDEHGVRVHRILKNGVYFSTRELEQLGTKKKDLMAEYEEKQRDIVNKCMEVAMTFVPVLERCSVLLAELDVIASFAHVAAYSSKGYCRPEMTDSEEDGLGIEVSILFSSISNCD
jgi:DNA mismatch repair protein MSH2